MNRLVSGAIGVEIRVLATDNKLYFPDIPLLRGKRIKHVDACNPYNFKTPTGKDVIEHLNSTFVTFVESNTKEELIKSLPLSLLSSDSKLYINKIIDLPLSYIDLSHLSEAEKEDFSLYFVFWYDEPAVWGVLSEKNNSTEIHSLELTLTGQRTYFAKNAIFENRRVQNLLFSLPYFTPTGSVGLRESYYQNKFLTLARGQVEFIKQVPLYLFMQTDPNYAIRLQNIVFDLVNSYIETTTTNADDLKTCFFNVILDDNKK